MASGRGLFGIGFLFIVFLMATTVEIWPHSETTMLVNAARPKIGVTKRDAFYDPEACGQTCKNVTGGGHECSGACGKCRIFNIPDPITGETVRRCAPSVNSDLFPKPCGQLCKSDSDCEIVGPYDLAGILCEGCKSAFTFETGWVKACGGFII